MPNTEPCTAELVQVGIREEVTFGTDPGGSALYVGPMGAHDPPDPKKTWNVIRGRASGRKPYTISSGRSVLRGKQNLTLINPKMLLFLMGSVADVGTDDGAGGSTVATENVIGATTIAVAERTGYADADYIQIGETTLAEIRQIASGGGLTGAGTFTLNAPMRKVHAVGAVCNEVIAPFTHTFTHKDGPLPSFTWEEGLVNTTNLIKKYTGCRIDGAELSMEEGGQLLAGFDVAAQLATTGTLSTLVVPSTEPYSSEMATFNLYGSAFADVSKWSINYKNNLKEVYAQGSANSSNPRYIVAGPADVTAKVTREFLDLTCWSFVYGPGAKFDAVFTLTRTAATDTLVITLKNCRLAEAKQSVPESQNIPENQDLLAEYMTAVAVDSTPHY